MHIGAVLIATGNGLDPLQPSGNVFVAQRMVATLQKAGVAPIIVITGPQDKRIEKQLAQFGVFFLNNPTPEDEQLSAQLGMDYLCHKCDRVFFLKADRPLVDPETLVKMMEQDADVVVPVYQGQQGDICLVKSGIKRIAAKPMQVTVEDSGILISPEECTEELLMEHDRKLTRLMLDFSISRGKTLVDRKLAVLLYQIRETQSVRDACSRMQISYSTAWNLLNTAEDELGYPLILRNKGGPSGSGSMLTEKGSTLLTAYEQFETTARSIIETLYETYFQDII